MNIERGERRVWRGWLVVVLAVPGWLCAGTLAQFRTPLGDIEVELFEKDKPVTVANFVRYVESGRWQDMFAHRLVPGFVIQGGGWQVVNRGAVNQGLGTVPVFGKITNEFAVGPRLSNVYGTIAMAKEAGNPDSASSQWFINLGNNAANLDGQNGGFTVFGQVVRGTNVLETLNRFVFVSNPGSATRSTNVVMNIGGALSELPLLRTNATYADLLYVDVTLLGVQVTDRAGVKEISWNSVAGQTNHVEFTSVLPPAWKSLVATNGTGTRLTVTDSASSSGHRFYRVRVEY